MTPNDRPAGRRRPWSRRAPADPADAMTGPAGYVQGRGSRPAVPPPRRPDTDPEPATGRPHGFGRALAFTVVGSIIPGTGLLAAGRRRIGAVVLALFVLLVAAGVFVALARQRSAIRIAVDTTALLWVIGGAAVIALAWVLVVVGSYRSLRPRRLRAWQRALGVLVVAVLCLGVLAPAVLVVRLAVAQRDLVDSVFADRDSATVHTPEDASDPFAGRDAINVLLLGGDGGAGRDGVRTDTVIVAHVETATGRTTLFSLPRNLEELPFPAGSPLAAVYPDGFDAGSESESLLNAVYRNGPAMYPDILGPTADPGADFLKLGVGEALGLPIDYYMLVNLDGFSRLVDALGGITLNVNYYVPINGQQAEGELPDGYIAPGPHQHMSGTRALDFARGRYGLTDYLRMDRQRCVLQAIVQAADPVTLLTQYQELASTTQDIVSTDVPQSVLGDLIDLAFQVKEAGIRSVVFDNSVIDPAYPDYPAIRELVQQALTPAVVTTAPVPTTAAPSTTVGPLPAPPTTEGGVPVETVADACAYDPVQAAAARAAGEPPSLGR